MYVYYNTMKLKRYSIQLLMFTLHYSITIFFYYIIFPFLVSVFIMLYIILIFFILQLQCHERIVLSVHLHKQDIDVLQWM